MLHTDIVVYAKIVGDRHRLTLGGHDIRWLSLAQQIDIHVETRNFRVDIFIPHVVCWLLAVGRWLLAGEIQRWAVAII